MCKEFTISEIVKSVSITHSFNKESLIFLNTSDVLEGRILKSHYSPIESLKGQAKKTIKKNDILFSEIRPRNKRYAFVEIEDTEDYVVSTKLMVLRKFNEDVLHKYFYYFLTYSGTLDYLQMRAENRIGSFPQITFDILKPIKVNVPSIQEQQVIIDIISALDDKLELNNKINNELEVLAKAIYDYWFVQFDFPDKNGKPYKSSGGKMVYNDVLKRKIPEGWRAGTLSDLGDIIGGSTPPRDIEDFFTNNGTPWITPKDLSLNAGNKFITKGELDVSKKGIKAASLNIMPANSILLSSRAPIGYLAISRTQVTTNQGFKSFVTNKGFSTEFVYYAIKNMIPAIENNAVGSTFKEISGNTLKSIAICIPDKLVVEKYNQKISSIFKRQDIAELENQHLSKLRDWLLPMLMNGQVSFGKAYEQVEEALSMAAEPFQKYNSK